MFGCQEPITYLLASFAQRKAAGAIFAGGAAVDAPRGAVPAKAEHAGAFAAVAARRVSRKAAHLLAATARFANVIFSAWREAHLAAQAVAKPVRL